MYGDLTPVGIDDDTAAEIATRAHVPHTEGITRVRRHLFISYDIRIKAFTFNQN